MRIDFKKIFTRWDVLAVISVFIIVFIVSYITFFSSNFYSAKSPVTFDIKKGEDFYSVINRLYEKGIIPN
ncbi:MAG: hypothetical protein WBN42_04245, partial [Ignavibacteriaceae bacterium]